MKYFLLSLIIFGISFLDSMQKSVDSLNEEAGTCLNPLKLFQEPLSHDLENFEINVDLKEENDKLNFECFPKYRKFLSIILSIVYTFKIENHMYIEFSEINKKNTTSVIITDSENNKEYDFFTLKDGTSKNIYLESGSYNLILTRSFRKMFFEDDNFTAHLRLSKYKVNLRLNFKKEPSFTGSFNNPIAIFNKESDELVFELTKNSYRSQLNCSLEKSPSVVLSGKIPNDTIMYLDIDLYSDSNKLDTVLGLTNGLHVENWCNDDSSLVGGLSSNLNGILTSGDYKLIAASHNNQIFGTINIKILMTTYKVGSIGPIILDDTKNEKFNGSFITNKNSIKCECNSKEIYRYVVIPLEIPNGLIMNGYIKAYGANKTNKLDTILEIRNDLFRTFQDKKFCNDDSSHVGGLSSFLNVTLSSGSYELVLGEVGNERFEPFTIEFDFAKI
ncbi:unnamed protein product [Brachionus calyciflorus]|uniref:Uncharacterized protein n=1 Tax=Brachionus calyciflorus TaxID=104777 RepID=A0A813ZDA0_9BILA|nr:unnamed protein product [Brachionus calyciflorus]